MILKEIDINSYVQKFVSKQNPQIESELLKELHSYCGEFFSDLIHLQRIKLIEKNIYEVRIYNPTGKIWFRFFGFLKNQTLYLVHSIKKKTNKLSRRDIEISKRRIKEYENK